MTDDDFKLAEMASKMKQAEDLAGDLYPQCPCFGNGLTMGIMNHNASVIGNALYDMASSQSNVCPSAAPFVLAQAIAITLCHYGAEDVGDEAGNQPEQIIMAAEENAVKFADQLAKLIPGMVALGLKMARREASLLGKLPIAAARPGA